MLNNVFLDQHGYIWFKSENSSLWHDHPHNAFSNRVRTDIDGKPQLAGKEIVGVAIKHVAEDLASQIINSMNKLNLTQIAKSSILRQLKSIDLHANLSNVDFNMRKLGATQ